MKPPHQQARCVRCGYTGPLGAFEVEVALSADDSGDNDWVINFSCPACESAERPHVLAPGDGHPAGAARRSAPVGAQRANPMYDPAAP